MALHFSKHVKFTSVILCTVTGAGVFACKYLGEVSVATSIYVFKSLILFADELMFCSWTAAELICGRFFLASSEAAWPFLFGVEKMLINIDFFPLLLQIHLYFYSQEKAEGFSSSSKSSLNLFKARLDRAWSSLEQWKVPSHGRGATGWALSSFQPKPGWFHGSGSAGLWLLSSASAQLSLPLRDRAALLIRARWMRRLKEHWII